MIVQCRRIEIPGRRKSADLLPPLREQNVPLLLDKPCKLIEDLGASLKVDNKPAERNSSIFDKVKDIFG